MNKSYYAIIPATVRYDDELVPNAKLLYGEVTSLCNEKGYCWAKNGYFADLYKVSQSSISRWLTLLTRQGYLKIELKYKKGSKEIDERHIMLIDPIRKNEHTPMRKNEQVNNTKSNKDTKVSINGVSLPLKELQIKYNPILIRTIKNIAGFRTNLMKDTKVMRSVYQSLVELEHNQFFKDRYFSEAMKKGKMLHGMNTSRIENISGNMKRLEMILKKASKEFKRRKEDRKQFLMPDKMPALSDFFYNEEYKNSWFLHCACCDPMIKGTWKSDTILNNIVKSLEKDVTDLNKLVSKIYNNTDMKDWDTSDKASFYTCIRKLIDWRKENRTILSEKNDGWRTHFGSDIHMFNTVGYFLDDCFPRPVPKFLEPDGKNWKQFIGWALNSYDVNLKI